MLTIVGAIEVISALLLIVLILMHSPKGDGIAGIGNAAQMFTSQKSAEKGLNKLTGIVAGILLLILFAGAIGLVSVQMKFSPEMFYIGEMKHKKL